ncbi:MAG: phosphoesterase [Deltaproteobacteria bacterium]|nr:phosphoesterase [Deltaproteobacteria bacterium]
MPTTYYCISDLHIGGDEALGVCDYEAEFIAFLEELAATQEDCELLIIGDIFGLWEFTDIQGPAKLGKLLEQFPAIFEAFRRAGEKIAITMLPGNHDYEIACYPEYVEKLKPYNINLEQTPAITRQINGQTIWIEHGNQYDAYNRMPDFGNPHAHPIGYFLTSNVVSTAGKHSHFGRYNWLKDIQSVYPTEQVPYWIFSNYFYHEMSGFLRWLLLPFLLFSGFEVFILLGAALEFFGMTSTNIFLHNWLFTSLGFVGNLVQLIIIINTILFVTFIILAVPLYLIWRDFRATLRRFQIVLNPAELSSEKEQKYLDAAAKVFEAHPEVTIFVYGHTHKPSLRQLGQRAVINTGTWLKRLDDVPPRFGFLPKIYLPFFCLNYFRISEAEGRIAIDYRKIPKAPPQDLTFLQRWLVSKKRRKPDAVPENILLETGVTR